MQKSFLFIIIISFGFNFNCSTNLEIPSGLISDKWISISNPRCEIWFQNWCDYSRLLFIQESDTMNVPPSPYVTENKDKPYLEAKSYYKVEKKQLKGNIFWFGTPSWDNGITNTAVWKVDRANPKINLPQDYIISLEMMNDTLKINVEEENKPFFSGRFKSVKSY
tara:strand:+ start:1306 stop:1800 length:495 start_codon:yes stop_codon:yes gene_type:complete